MQFYLKNYFRGKKMTRLAYETRSDQPCICLEISRDFRYYLYYTAKYILNHKNLFSFLNNFSVRLKHSLYIYPLTVFQKIKNIFIYLKLLLIISLYVILFYGLWLLFPLRKIKAFLIKTKRIREHRIREPFINKFILLKLIASQKAFELFL